MGKCLFHIIDGNNLPALVSVVTSTDVSQNLCLYRETGQSVPL